MKNKNSSTEKPPFDLELMQMQIALHSTPIGLFSKLKFIWYFTVRLIALTEKKYSRVIKKHWGLHAKVALNNASLIKKSNIAAKYNINNSYHDDSISTAYFSALNKIREINCDFNCIEDGIFVYSSRLIFTKANDDEFLRNIFSERQEKCQAFLDHVVPHFFPLQLYCLKLAPVINSAPGVPIDPLKRTQRAVTAAMARNYGQELLKSDILNIIENHNPKNKYPSVSDLFIKLQDDLTKTLETYQKRVGSVEPTSGKKISYGSSLTAPMLLSKLKKWAKDDAVFREHLEKICVTHFRKNSP